MEVTIKEWRALLGLSLDDLSEKSGVGKSNISRIENHLQQPRPSTLRKIAAALGVEVEDLWSLPEGKLAA